MNDKSNNGMLVLVILASVICSGIASGLGVGPVQKYVVFEPGVVQNLSLYVFNNENRTISFDISARGELSSRVTLDRSVYFMAEDQASLKIPYSLAMPQELSPGPHTADIVITEVPQGQGTVVAAQSQVSRLTVQVPYPGYNAQAKMLISQRDDGAGFEIQVYDYGTSDITASAVIDIYTNSTLVRSVDAGSVSIGSMEQKSIIASTKLPPGDYRAVAHVIYEGGQIDLEQAFQAGKRYIEITGITVDSFRSGEVARIRFSLLNRWPEPIEGVVGDMLVMKNGKVIDTVTTDTFGIDRTAEVSAYWNTKGLEPGTYDARMNLVYGKDITSRNFTLLISEAVPKPRLSSGLIILALLILVTALAIIMLWQYQRRGETKNKQK